MAVVDETGLRHEHYMAAEDAAVAADLVADGLADVAAVEFFGDAVGDGDRHHRLRLRADDEAAEGLCRELRQLRCLPAAGLRANDQDSLLFETRCKLLAE